MDSFSFGTASPAPGTARHIASRHAYLKLLILCACVHAKSLQLCLTLCNSTDCKPARLLCP